MGDLTLPPPHWAKFRSKTVCFVPRFSDLAGDAETARIKDAADRLWHEGRIKESLSPTIIANARSADVPFSIERATALVMALNSFLGQNGTVERLHVHGDIRVCALAIPHLKALMDDAKVTAENLAARAAISVRSIEYLINPAKPERSQLPGRATGGIVAKLHSALAAIGSRKVPPVVEFCSTEPALAHIGASEAPFSYDELLLEMPSGFPYRNSRIGQPSPE